MCWFRCHPLPLALWRETLTMNFALSDHIVIIGDVNRLLVQDPSVVTKIGRSDHKRVSFTVVGSILRSDILLLKFWGRIFLLMTERILISTFETNSLEMIKLISLVIKDDCFDLKHLNKILIFLITRKWAVRSFFSSQKYKLYRLILINYKCYMIYVFIFLKPQSSLERIVSYS